ncbi:MAG: nitroreductase family protein [Thaumarchaeota archaeon]|jgi:nitroreductase|nr:nitroreductase family protein [Candidatus Terraquivivens yellowstonensis]MCL7399596.1 nitroreductase family protein [Candidatus Terraquivivens yellowstonensis]
MEPEELLNIIKGRRSVRSFLEKKIPDEHLKLIMEAGIWAPSGSNIQPWQFVLVREPELIRKIKLVSPGLFGNPDALVVACVDRNRYERAGKLGYTLSLMDVSMAAQNMMLMAYSLGIGSCPIASFSKLALKEILGLPDNFEPVLMISLGYPEKWPSPPERRPLSEVVYVNGYGKHYRG